MRQTLVFQIMQLEIFFTTYYMFDKLIYLDCKITVSPAIFFLLGKQRFQRTFSSAGGVVCPEGNTCKVKNFFLCYTPSGRLYIFLRFQKTKFNVKKAAMYSNIRFLSWFCKTESRESFRWISGYHGNKFLIRHSSSSNLRKEIWITV